MEQVLNASKYCCSQFMMHLAVTWLLHYQAFMHSQVVILLVGFLARARIYVGNHFRKSAKQFFGHLPTLAKVHNCKMKTSYFFRNLYVTCTSQRVRRQVFLRYGGTYSNMCKQKLRNYHRLLLLCGNIFCGLTTSA